MKTFSTLIAVVLLSASSLVFADDMFPSEKCPVEEERYECYEISYKKIHSSSLSQLFTDLTPKGLRPSKGQLDAAYAGEIVTVSSEKLVSVLPIPKWQVRKGTFTYDDNKWSPNILPDTIETGWKTIAFMAFLVFYVLCSSYFGSKTLLITVLPYTTISILAGIVTGLTANSFFPETHYFNAAFGGLFAGLLTVFFAVISTAKGHAPESLDGVFVGMLVGAITGATGINSPLAGEWIAFWLICAALGSALSYFRYSRKNTATGHGESLP